MSEKGKMEIGLLRGALQKIIPDNVKNPDIRLGANIKNGNAPYAYMSGDYMLATPNNNRIYDARQYLYPVPQNQINLTFGAVTQNPLWK